MFYYNMNAAGATGFVHAFSEGGRLDVRIFIYYVFRIR